MPKRYIRKLLSISVVAIILTLLILPLLPLSIGAATWEFRYPVFVTDNTSTNRVQVPVMTGMNGQSFIDAGKVNPDGLNTNFQQGSTDLKYMIADGNITMVVPDLPSNAMATTNFYTGYAPEKTSFEIVPGPGGYFTVADNWSLELGRPFLNFFEGPADSVLDLQAQHNAAPKLWVSMWVNMPTGWNAGDGSRYIWNKRTGGADLVTCRFENAGRLLCDRVVGGGGFANLVTAGITSWNATQWYNLIFSNSDVNGYKIVVNGNQAAINADLSPAPVGGNITVGDWAPGAAEGFTGQVTNIVIGTTDLTNAQQLAIYEAGIGGFPSDITINNYYRVNEGTGFVVTDYGPDGVDGQAGFDTTWSDNPFGWTYESTGYINTDNGTGKYLISKPSAFEVEVSPFNSGNITARIIGGTLTDNLTYAGSDDNSGTIGEPFRRAQTFVPNSPILVTAVNLTLHDAGAAAGTLYVAIVGTVGGGPNQSDNLSQGLMLNSNTVIGALAANYTVNVTPVWLSVNTSYAIVAWNTVPNINIHIDNTAPSYPQGWDFTTPDSGLTWTPGAGNDVLFSLLSRYDQATATGVASGEHTVTVTANTTSFNILIDGTLADNTTVLTVLNTSDNYTFQYNAVSDFMPYSSNVSVWIAGNDTAANAMWFQPNTMIIGDELPNRALAGNPGTFVWGTNPANELIVSYGAMVGFESTSAPSGTAGTENVPAAPMPPNWFATGNETSNLPFYGMVSQVVASMDFPDFNTGVQTIYSWWIFGTSFALFMLMLATTRSMVFALIAFEVPLIVGSQQTVIPTWVPVAVALLSLGILMLYHKLSR